jgi:predicted NBD/HSP70 family sugar kinase
VEHTWQESVGHEGYIRQIIDSIREVQHAAIAAGNDWATRIDAIGIALRGLVDVKSGTPLGYAPLHKLDAIPVGQMIADRTGYTVVVDNNVLVMAWGEYWFGAGRGIDNLLCINVGRGVGGSAIVNSQLLRGPDGSMLEIGHTTVDTEGARCWCGNYGCLELYASDTSVVRRVIKSIKLGHATILTDMTSNELQQLTIDTICAAANLGDALSLQAIHEAALYMAVGMTNLINLLDGYMM